MYTAAPHSNPITERELFGSREQMLFEIERQQLLAPDQIRFGEADMFVQTVDDRRVQGVCSGKQKHHQHPRRQAQPRPVMSALPGKLVAMISMKLDC